MNDHVDRTLSEWQEQLPDLDLSGRQIVWRITLLAKLLDKAIEDVIATYGITSSGFKLMLALRRSAPEFRRSPKDLSQWVLLTSGAMTALIDRIEEAGLVERSRDPTDRRGVLVGLTSAGIELIDQAHAAYLEEESSILAALSTREQGELSDLLRKLVLELEDSDWFRQLSKRA